MITSQIRRASPNGRRDPVPTRTSGKRAGRVDSGWVGLRVGVVLGVLAMLVAATACQPQRTLTVLAAASLTESFDQIIVDYRAAHPGVAIRISYGSSATLATQITSGAPADVFASANESTMSLLVAAGLDVHPATLTTNQLQIVVAPGNPAGITGLADFAREDLRVALCADEVPCGSAAARLFATAGVTPKPDTYEVDVKATLRKVELGEADLALIYRTDVAAAGDRVVGLPTPGAETTVNLYQIAALPQPSESSNSAQSSNSAEAARFVSYVLAPASQQVLARYGFGDG